MSAGANLALNCDIVLAAKVGQLHPGLPEIGLIPIMAPGCLRRALVAAPTRWRWRCLGESAAQRRRSATSV